MRQSLDVRIISLHASILLFEQCGKCIYRDGQELLHIMKLYHLATADWGNVWAWEQRALAHHARGTVNLTSMCVKQEDSSTGLDVKILLLFSHELPFQ